MFRLLRIADRSSSASASRKVRLISPSPTLPVLPESEELLCLSRPIRPRG